MKFSRIILVASTAMLALNAFAADIVGKYTGKVTMDMSSARSAIQKQAAKLSGEQKKQVEAQLAMVDNVKKATEAMTLKLEIVKGGVAKISQTANGKSSTESGKWTVSGNTVKLFGFSGKSGGPKEMSGVVKNNGKVLFFDMSAEVKKQTAKMSPQQAALAPKVSISFSR
ncbi:MAG TPA: hypothetical protein VK171_03735 [Fimbriimonas sp.]|nr:hypothetical protein [Fimbriimonas sp.]